MSGRTGRQGSWPPLTVTKPELLIDGSDQEFRNLVDDLVEFSARLQSIREKLAARMGVSAPQYRVIMTLARSETPELAAKGLAQQLGVSMPFITIEAGKLVRLGLIARRRNPADARSVLFALTIAGRDRVRKAAPVVRDANDRLFESLSRSDMLKLARTARALIDGSEQALARLGREPP